jgi:hypothetical protein
MKHNPAVATKDIQKSLANSLEVAGISGYVNQKLLEDFYSIYSWVYCGKPGSMALDTSTELGKFLSMIEFERFIGDSISYSAVLLYQKLSQKLCMRSMSDGVVMKGSSTINRMFTKEDFICEDLYSLYTGTEYDIPKELLTFSSLFTADPVADNKKMTSYGELPKIVHIEKLFVPTAGYDIATKNIEVRHNVDVVSEVEHELVVIQDCSLSMRNHSKELAMIKAYVLNEAFRHNFSVRWMYVNIKLVDQVIYSGDGDSFKTPQVFSGYDFCFRDVLSLQNIQNKNAVIITDGTDSFFTLPKQVNMKTINMISINFNKELKNKILAYGRFFSIK